MVELISDMALKSIAGDVRELIKLLRLPLYEHLGCFDRHCKEILKGA